MYACMYAHAHIDMNAHVKYAQMYGCMTCTHMHKCTCMNTCVFMHSTHAQVRIACVCLCVCVRVCIKHITTFSKPTAQQQDISAIPTPRILTV